MLRLGLVERLRPNFERAVVWFNGPGSTPQSNHLLIASDEN